MMQREKEVIDVTSRAFPTTPIFLASKEHSLGPLKLKAGKSVLWKKEGGKDTYLKNTQRFRSMLFEVVAPESVKKAMTKTRVATSNGGIDVPGMAYIDGRDPDASPPLTIAEIFIWRTM